MQSEPVAGFVLQFIRQHGTPKNPVPLDVIIVEAQKEDIKSSKSLKQ